MDCIVHGVTKSHKRLSYFHLFYLEDPLEEAWQPTPEFLPGEPMDRGACLATVCGVILDRRERTVLIKQK